MHFSFSPLAELSKLEQYQQRTSNVFQSIESLRWYIRQHRKELVAGGGLLYIAGKHWVYPEKFDACVLAAGSAKGGTE